MSKIHVTNSIDHDVMYEAEQVSYTPEVRAIWTKDYFMKRRRDLPAIGIADGEKSIGGVYMEHGFIHWSVAPDYHGKWAVAYFPCLEWALSQANPIYAGIMESNEKCLRYAEHSGWEQVGRFNQVVFYRSTEDFFLRLLSRRQHAKSARADISNLDHALT